MRCVTLRKNIACSKLVLVVLTLIFTIQTVTCQFDLKEYMKMPPMHQLHDYEACLLGTDHFNAYCVIHAIIKPDNDSAVYKQVIEFSNDTKKHFAHDLLYRGYCLSFCEQELIELSEDEREKLYVEPFPWRLNRKWYDSRDVFANTTLYRKLYDKTFNQCINLWLQKHYNLSAQSTIEFCSTNQDVSYRKYDHWHYIFIIVTLSILILVTYGTYIDMRFNDIGTLEHYKKEIRKQTTTTQDYLICFSLIRNWYRLTGQPKTELGRDLRCLNAFRYITVLIFIMAHLIFGYSAAAMINPQFIEMTYHSFETITLNNTNTVQTFFFISGFLLYITIKPTFKKNKFNFKYFVVGVIYRVIRLSPPIAFLVLYNASFMADSGEGPFWKYFGEAEKTFCRRSWWTNLLFINNFVNTEELCMGHLWYVAADTQLFIFTLLLCVVMFKFWKYRKQILGTTFLLSFVTHFATNYINKHDGIFLFSPEKRRSFVYDITKDIKTNYFASYINTGNYLLGVVGAMLYFHCKNSKLDLGKSKIFIFIWHLTVPLAHIVLAVSGYIFYNNYFELPSVWISLTAVFVQNIWGIFATILVLGFSSNFKSPAKNFCNWPIFTSLSRLTYGIYLCHLTIVRPLLGQQVVLPYLSFSSLFVQMIALSVLCHIFALILCLCLEFPLTAIAKKMLGKKGEEDSKIKANNELLDTNLNHVNGQIYKLLPFKVNNGVSSTAENV